MPLHWPLPACVSKDNGLSELKIPSISALETSTRVTRVPAILQIKIFLEKLETYGIVQQRVETLGLSTGSWHSFHDAPFMNASAFLDLVHEVIPSSALGRTQVTPSRLERLLGCKRKAGPCCGTKERAQEWLNKVRLQRFRSFPFSFSSAACRLFNPTSPSDVASCYRSVVVWFGQVLLPWP